MAPKPKKDAPTNCVVCNQPEGDDTESVNCEACRLWAHSSCAGVAGKEEYYFCPNCTQSLQVPKERKNAKKPKSDAGTTAGAAELPKDLQDQLVLEQAEREKKMAQDVLIRIKRMELEKKDCEKQLRIEREMQERELAAANELRAMKLKLEQEFLDKQLAAEQEFLLKQKEIRKLVTKSKLKMEKPKKNEMDPETPKGIPPKLPRPGISESEGEESSKDDEEGMKTPDSTANKVSDGPGKSVMKLTKEQLAARQAMKQLPKFSGEPEVWPLFISSFNYTTEACGFTNLDNLTRLVECLRGPALELVQSRLVLPDAVPDVIEDLRHMFGRPEKLLRALLVKVRSAPAPTTDNLDTFIHFGITVKQLCDHLEVSGMKDHLSNPMLVQELVERLPTSYQLDWVRYRRGKVKTPLRLLSDFLSELVEDVSEVAEFAALSLQEPTKPHGGKGRRNEFVHVHEVAMESATGSRTSLSCYVCKRTNHLIRNCNEFRGMQVPERLLIVERLQLCKLCLSNHGNSQCCSKMRCQIGNCQGQHHPLLHREDGARQVQRVDCNTHKVDSGVIFRMAPITLHVGSKTLNTLAFLDEGSSSTLMEEYVANKLGVQGQREPLVVSWTSEIDRHENQSRRVSLTLSARGSTEMFQLENVRTVSKMQLPQQDVRFAEVKKRYAHLAGVQVVDQGKEQPTILIGLDNIHLFAPLESRIGLKGEPIAVRSKLGWSVYGPKKPKPLVHTFLNVHVVKHGMMSNQYVLDKAGIASFAVPEFVEEKRAENKMKTTTTRAGERFEIPDEERRQNWLREKEEEFRRSEKEARKQREKEKRIERERRAEERRIEDEKRVISEKQRAGNQEFERKFSEEKKCGDGGSVWRGEHGETTVLQESSSADGVWQPLGCECRGAGANRPPSGRDDREPTGQSECRLDVRVDDDENDRPRGGDRGPTQLGDREDRVDYRATRRGDRQPIRDGERGGPDKMRRNDIYWGGHRGEGGVDWRDSGRRGDRRDDCDEPRRDGGDMWCRGPHADRREGSGSGGKSSWRWKNSQTERTRPLKTGDPVYITDGKIQKFWFRGVVEESTVSDDGRIRQAWVRTSSGLVKSAAARLAVLDIEGKPASEATSEPGLRAGECYGYSLPRRGRHHAAAAAAAWGTIPRRALTARES